MSDPLFVSGYNREASQRAARIGANADVRPEHYQFARRQKLYTPPLEKTRPVESLGRVLAVGLLGVAAIVFCMAILSAAQQIVGAW